jgi:hypothetical protein
VVPPPRSSKALPTAPDSEIVMDLEGARVIQDERGVRIAKEQDD